MQKERHNIVQIENFCLTWPAKKGACSSAQAATKASKNHFKVYCSRIGATREYFRGSGVGDI